LLGLEPSWHIPFVGRFSRRWGCLLLSLDDVSLNYLLCVQLHNPNLLELAKHQTEASK
jgi:hypothetical protein